MSELPKQIWIDGAYHGCEWRDKESACLSPHGPYIRADLCDPLSDPRVVAMVEALEGIAMQKKTDELVTVLDVEYADFEGGYDACVDRARTALAALKK